MKARKIAGLLMLVLASLSMLDTVLITGLASVPRYGGPSGASSSGDSSGGEWLNSSGENPCERQVKGDRGFGDERELSDACEWKKPDYLDDNATRLVVGLSVENVIGLTSFERIISEYEAEIVNTVSIKNKVEALVVVVPPRFVAAFVEKVKGSGFVSYVEPSMRVQAQFVPNDPLWSLQWGPQRIGADWAWNTTMGDQSVLVAVVDTGVCYTHPDLAANYVPLGYDWVNNDNDPMDDHGHGTHCAGIIAAVLNNSVGVAGLAQVRIMAEKVLDGGGGGYWDWVANGIIHAADKGARIISMSLGGYGYSELLHKAVKYAYDAGVLVIAAAGNDYTDARLYPAGYDEVVAVAATDQNDGKAWFSNWGECIELAAPGVDIYSTVPWGYESWSGTSMACPHVSGVAALVLSHFRAKSRDWIRLWLRYTAKDLGAPGFDVYYGWGRIDARNAVETSPPIHDLTAYKWQTPPYVELNNIEMINATVVNFGEANATDISIRLLANETVICSTSIGFLASGCSETVSLSWNPTFEGFYNLTFYILPEPGETSTENNVLQKTIYVGFPVKAVVLHSAGNVEAEAVTTWQVLTTQWYEFGNTMTYVDYTTLDRDNIDYEDIRSTEADVLIISCAYDPWAGWEFTDAEIEAIRQYVYEGHGLIATAGTLYEDVPNNNKLAPLFGLNETVSWNVSHTYRLLPLNASHPIFRNVPDPLVLPAVETTIPADGCWDSDELARGQYLAMGRYSESAIVAWRGLLYISPWLEVIEPSYHSHLQLLYNAIVWSRYQRPQHDLSVSVFAPKYIQPGEPARLNATVTNMGASDESSVELHLIVNDAEVASESIPDMPWNSSYTLRHLWSPTLEGTYNVTCYVTPVPGEEDTSDNVKSVDVRVVVFSKMILLVADDDASTKVYKGTSLQWFEIILTSAGYDYLVWQESTMGRPSLDFLRKFKLIIWTCGDYFAGAVDSVDAQNLEAYLAQGGNILLEGEDIGYDHGSDRFMVNVVHAVYVVDDTGASGLNVTNPLHPVTQELPADIPWIERPPYADGVTPTNGGFEVIRYYGGREMNWTAVTVFDGESAGYGSVVYYAFPMYCLTWRFKLVVNSVKWLQRSQHDLSVTVGAPAFLKPGDSSMLNATVCNHGLCSETNVELYLLLEGGVVNSTTILELAVMSSYTITYVWTPAAEGTYNITACAPPVVNETFVLNNQATSFVAVTQPSINPFEGQFANYSMYHVDTGSGQKLFAGFFNLTYLRYVSPYRVNVTMVTVSPNYSQVGWMVIDVFTRIVEADSGIGWTGMWYLGWIETNVAVGSSVNLLYGRGTVVNNQVVYINGHPIDCWEIRLGYYGCWYTFLYDKASGLLVYTNVSSSCGIPNLMLTATNISVGFVFQHDLTVTLDAPSGLASGESTTLNATVYNIGLSNEVDVVLQLMINGSIVGNVTINELPVNERCTLDYPWTPTRTGPYNVTVYAQHLLGEDHLADNLVSRKLFVFLYTRSYIPHQWVDGGIPMNWHCADGSWRFDLPFDFPFFGKYYRTIYVSNNGLITFLGPDTDYTNSIPALAQKIAISPAWTDWATYDPYDIYVWQNSTHIGIRWYVSSKTNSVANFEAVLSYDGVIQFDYEHSNGPAPATIGISDGAGHIFGEDLMDLNLINSIVFAPYTMERDVAVTNIMVFSSAVNQGWIVEIDVTVANLGNVTEAFILTLYCNSTVIAAQAVQYLARNESKAISFCWNTTDVAYCSIYIMKAVAGCVPGEANTANNALIDGQIRVKIMGDVDGDNKVDMSDINKLLEAFGSFPGHPRWDPSADLCQDEKTDIEDIVMALSYFGKAC